MNPGGTGLRLRLRDKSKVENLVHVVNKLKLQVLGNIFWDVFEVFLVGFGGDDGFEASKFGTNHFFFEAANLQDPTPKGDLAGHADELFYRYFSEGRGKSNGDGNAG